MFKENSISLIRLLAMIMIVTCHIFQYLNNELAWWFNVGVQIFFTMSGFLYGRKTVQNPWKWIKQNFYKILLDYYIYIAIVLIFYFIAAKELLNLDLIFANLFVVTGFRQGIAGIEHLWYISYILICYLITPILQSLYEQIKNKNEAVFWLTLFTIIALGEIYQTYAIVDVYMPRIACYLFGYFIAKRYGGYENKEDNNKNNIALEKVKNKLSLKSLTLILVIVTLLMNSYKIYIKYINYTELPGIFGKIIHDYSHSLLGISLFFGMYWLFTLILSNKSERKGLLYYSDKYSYDIYIVHQIYILGKFTKIGLTEYLALDILIISILIIISAILLQFIRNGLIIACHFLFGKKRKPE